MGQMDFISSIFVRFFFQNYLGSISLITRYRCICWSVPTVCVFYPDSQTVETLRSACIFMCRLVMLSFIKHFGTSSVISDQTSMYMCSLVIVFCCRHISVKQLTFEIYIILCQYFIKVLFRVLKIKINLVKLTFWTAISSHQVMGMSLTKVWVMENIPR